MKVKRARKVTISDAICVLICIVIFTTSTGFRSINENVEAVNLVQNAALGISSPLYEGGTVYFTITIKNTGSTTSPHFHPYVEGYTSTGQLFRADNSNPSTYQLSPGSSKTFTTSHDLWYGHSGTWETYGIYLWNDDTNSYYGQLNANGYDQSKSFNVLGVNDIRQNGPISISGNLQEGGIVYLDIPIKNFGSATSMAMHVYTEGYTSQNKLWRADGAEPTAVQLAPGQTKTIRVRHDIWYGHAGAWTTYGVYIWNDYDDTYFAPLNANGYDQTLVFNTTSTPVQSLDIQYWDDANKAIEISYDVISTNSDGSITVDLTVRNTRWIPLFWDINNVGFVTDRDNTINNIANLSFFPFPPRTTKTIERVRFPANSRLTFLYSKEGFNEEQYRFLVLFGGCLFLYAVIEGEVPTGDNFEDLNPLASTISDGLWDLVLNDLGAAIGSVATKWKMKDYRGAWETVLLNVSLWAEAFEKISGYLFKESFTKTRIISAIYTIGLLLHFYYMIRYLDDVIRTPSNPVVVMVPSTRPMNNTQNLSYVEEDTLTGEIKASQLSAEVFDVSSEHSDGFDPNLILDGNINTGWTSAMGETGIESITLRLSNNTPAFLTSIKINPGPVLNDHTGSAIKEYKIYRSIDSVNYNKIAEGSFTLGQLRYLIPITIPTQIFATEYVRIEITKNQSDNAVKYMDFGDILLYGTLTPANDLYEPDSTKEIARQIRDDGGMEAHNINHDVDQDWYYFYGQDSEMVTLNLSTVESHMDIKLDVFQPNGNLIFTYTQNPGVIKKFSATLTQTGLFTIKITKTELFNNTYEPPLNYSIGLERSRSNMFLPVILR